MNFNNFDHQLPYSVLNDLTKAMDGEHEAICFYEKLANMAPNASIKKQILEIRKDEIRHYQTFEHIYLCLTGCHYYPQSQPTCPNSFLHGSDKAFHDEQNTVDFYHTVARKVQEPWISCAFSEAASDEQNHAVWFLYFMQICSN